MATSPLRRRKRSTYDAGEVIAYEPDSPRPDMAHAHAAMKSGVATIEAVEAMQKPLSALTDEEFDKMLRKEVCFQPPCLTSSPSCFPAFWTHFRTTMALSVGRRVEPCCLDGRAVSQAAC